MQHTITEDKVSSISGVIASKNDSNKSKALHIESRFGPVIVNPENAICFPHGMPGIAGELNFCLTDMPNIKNEQFKLFQNLDTHSLSFIVIPTTHDNQLLEPVDIMDACSVLGIDKNNLLLLFIVTSHETKSGRRLSINAKAPIFVDVKNKVATQYVFQNNQYEIQHFIS